MYFEVTSKRNVIDAKGNDKNVTEKYLVENVELCSEAEYKVSEYLNGENDVVAVKLTNIKEFVNDSSTDDDDSIFLATLEATTINDAGEEQEVKYIVGLYEQTLEKATELLIQYIKQGFGDMKIISLKKTKLLGVLK